jgi:hypothetical protein
VDDAVGIEPISRPQFAANREIYSEYRKIWPSAAIFMSNRRVNSSDYAQIPYILEQGIFPRRSRQFSSKNSADWLD